MLFRSNSGTGRYLYLQIRFVDAKGPNPNYDEYVNSTADATTTSTVIARTPSGTNFSLSAPIYNSTNAVLLTAGT